MADERAYVNAYLEDDQQHVMSLYRDGSRLRGHRILARWTSFHRTTELNAEWETKLRRSRYVRGLKREGDFVRVDWTSRQVRWDMTRDENSPLVRAGIVAYEADVHPVLRWLVDEKVKIAKPRRCYIDIETDSRVSFAEKEKMRVLCWKLSDDSKQVVAGALLEDDNDAAEREVLAQFWKAVEPYDQIVCWNGSYDGEAFDFFVLKARSKKRGVLPNTKRWLFLDQLPVFERQNKTGSKSGNEKRSMRLGDIGEQVLGEGKVAAPDWVLKRWPEGKKGLGKLAWQLWEAGGEFRSLLFDYCGDDSTKLPRIEEETGYIALSQTIAEACGIFLDTDTIQPTRQVDGFMLRLGSERNYRFPTKVPFEGESSKFEGAFVLHPQSVADVKEGRSEEDARRWREMAGMRNGIAENVHVCDFSGMYPSIIISFNMSPETKMLAAPNGPIPEGCCRAPKTGVVFRTDTPGMLPTALREMIRLRQEWAEAQKNAPAGTSEWFDAGRRSMAYKVAANSFFGVVSTPYSRFYDRSVGESITTTGGWLIRKTLEEAKTRGMITIYGDTDSAFIMGVTRTEFSAFVDWCNTDLYRPLLKEQGCAVNTVKLAYEKEFMRLCLSTAKRYVGSYRHYKWSTACTCVKVKKGKEVPGTVNMKTFLCADCGKQWSEDNLPPPKGEPEIKGFEYKRGDSAGLAMSLQAEMFDLICGGLGIAEGPVPTDDLARYHEVLARVRRHVLEDPLEVTEVQLSKSLSRPAKDYATKEKKDGSRSLPPSHVQVALQLAARGESTGVGTRIEYVVVDGQASPAKVIPAADYDGTNVDRYHVWDTLVYPPTQRLLESAYPDHDWASWAEVRPAKLRGACGKRALEGQMAFDVPAVPIEQKIRTGGGRPPALTIGGGRKRASAAPRMPLGEAIEVACEEGEIVQVLARLGATERGDRPLVLRVGDMRLETGLTLADRGMIGPHEDEKTDRV